MKCTKCHHEMVRIEFEKDVYYWQCPACGNSMNRPKTIEEVIDELQKEDEE